MQLIIGNKNYSSWSLRAWLYLRASQIPFEERRIALFTDEWQRQIGQASPSRRVPVLVDGDVVVWDSLAIIEYLLERQPQALGWPESTEARAFARSMVCEMHSGFAGIRSELPQNLRRRQQLPLAELSESTRAEIERVQDVWQECRHRWGREGPWLFSQPSIADVFYAPVVLRFESYGIAVREDLAPYLTTVSAWEPVELWRQGALAENESLDFIDELHPIAATPIRLG